MIDLHLLGQLLRDLRFLPLGFRLCLRGGFVLQFLLLFRNRSREFRNRRRELLQPFPCVVHVRSDQIERQFNLAREPFRFPLRRHRQAVEICSLVHLLREPAPVGCAARSRQNFLRTLKRHAHRPLRFTALLEQLLRLVYLVWNLAQPPLQPAPVAR